MKGFLIFILGMITMFLLFIFVINVPSDDMQFETETQYEDDGTIEGITLFPEERNFAFSKKQLTVLSCFKQKNIALVEPVSAEKLKTEMLFMGADGDMYYDNLTIDIPDGQILKQMGIYQYETDDGKLKTVPIVRIEDAPKKEVVNKEIPSNKQNKK